MKKSCLSCLGIILLAILILGGAMVACIFIYGPRIDASSRKFIDDHMPAVLNTWDKDELFKLASPEFKSATTDEQISKNFASLKSKLGALKKYDVTGKGWHVNYTAGEGKVTTATYRLDAEFERGKAAIDVKLVQRAGPWEILGFETTLPLD